MKTQPLKGMRDLLPREQALRDYIQGQILATYRAAGFQRISTPILEDMENLDKSDGGDNLNLIFKVLKRGDKLEKALASGDEKQLSDMGLRYDLTLPLSRYYAAHRNELPHVGKLLLVAALQRLFQLVAALEHLENQVEVVAAVTLVQVFHVLQDGGGNALESRGAVGGQNLALNIVTQRLLVGQQVAHTF